VAESLRGDRALARWRLVLGRFAQQGLRPGLEGQDDFQRLDRVLEFLYGREYQGRGVRAGGPREGTLDPSVLTVPDWLREVRELFPSETAEVVERHALDRYGMTELVTDPEVLEKLEPSYELLKAVLAFKGAMQGPVLDAARALVRKVVEQLQRKLDLEVRRTLWGRLSRQHRTRHKLARNLDWQRTVRANLKNWDRDRRRLVVESLHFLSRVERHLPWHVIMAVDCSGSMVDSVIHSAVMAGIFAGLPSVRVSLVAFDTKVVDLSERVSDPVEVLMSVQLGGGTDIGRALGYCEELVQQPSRTLRVLGTDFYEGGSPERMIAAVQRLRGAGVRVLGLAALDEKAAPAYDRQMAERCVAAGAEVAALTPQRLAEWMGRVLF